MSDALDPADTAVLIEALTRWCQGYVEPFPDLSVAQARRIIAHFSAQPEPEPEPEPEPVRKFKVGDLVYKKSGSQWRGKVVGCYSTELTPFGVCVESIREKGSVQIYPEGALNKALNKDEDMT